MGHYLVIAGSSTIGQSIVNLLRKEGHTVFTTARDGSKIKPDMYLDATDFNAVDNAFEAAGQIDGVVNCSGSLWIKPAHLTSHEQYLDVINKSLTTAFATVRSAGKYMSQGGSCVLFSTAAALSGFANHEAIAAAKAGVIGLAMSASATYASVKLRVNVIAPGLVETNLTDTMLKSDVSRKVSESMHALGRLGTAEEIARGAIFFLDPKNSWITGQVLAIDGGLSHIHPRIKI